MVTTASVEFYAKQIAFQVDLLVQVDFELAAALDELAALFTQQFASLRKIESRKPILER